MGLWFLILSVQPSSAPCPPQKASWGEQDGGLSSAELEGETFRASYSSMGYFKFLFFCGVCGCVCMGQHMYTI